MRPGPKTIAPLLALLALCLLALAPATAAAATERTVTVEASATLKVPNDSASVGLSVSLERGSRTAALQAVSAKLRRVIGAVQAIPGVGDGDIRTGRISVRRSFQGERPTYRASEGIGVTLHEPDKAGELVATAIGAGATGIRGPNFFVGDTEAAATAALSAAFERARGRATALARAAGASLGQALSIDEGGGAEFAPAPEAKTVGSTDCAIAPAPARRVSADACAGPPPPTKPGVSTVSATVRVVFALQ
jgi:uncharacterized protein